MNLRSNLIILKSRKLCLKSLQIYWLIKFQSYLPKSPKAICKPNSEITQIISKIRNLLSSGYLNPHPFSQFNKNTISNFKHQHSKHHIQKWHKVKAWRKRHGQRGPGKEIPSNPINKTSKESPTESEDNMDFISTI